jgi:uncharacterized protein
MKTKEKKSSFFIRHPLGGMLVSMILVGLFSLIMIILSYIPALTLPVLSLEQWNYLFEILAGLISLLVYSRIAHERPDHFFTFRKPGEGFCMGWSILAVSCALVIFNIVIYKQVPGNLPAALLLALSAGICEEVLFRLIPLSVMMHADGGKEKIFTGCAVSSLIFGVFHGLNLIAGADPVNTLFQILYASGLGLIFAGIYVRTENLWLPIILHTILDFCNYALVADPSAEISAVLDESVDTFSAVFLIISTILFYISAFLIYRRKDSSEEK